MGNIAFGAIIKTRRIARGWTQEELANQVELSARYIQSLEAQDKLPSLETLFKFARALNTSPRPLLDPAWRDWKKGS